MSGHCVYHFHIFVCTNSLLIHAGKDKEAQCRKCVAALDALYEKLLVAIAKVEKVAPDADDVIKDLKDKLVHINEEADDTLDAAKLVRNKLRSFLASQ